MTQRKLCCMAILALVVVLVGSVPVFGQTPTTSAPSAPATAEPAEAPINTPPATINVYTALEDDQLARYLPLFQAKYPNIKVNVVRDSTGIVTAKLLAEKDNPQADVVWGLAATSLLVADQQGMLAPYAPAGLDKIRAGFRDAANPPHWVGIDAWFSAFCVNTEELKAKSLPMPTSWADLTNPAFKDSIVMPNPASSGTGYLSVAGLLQLKGDAEGWKYLDDLDKNVKVYLHSGSKPCAMAGTGEATIGISFDYRAIQEAATGEPIQPVFPTEGSGWEIEANALVKKAEIQDASKLFLDWALGDRIMKEYAKSYPVTAADTGVAIPDGYPKDPTAQLIENDFNWAAANRDKILQEWTKRYDAKSAPKS